MSYLLPCECGKLSPIEISQAGQTISCQCGRSLDVPAMREIRRLQTDDDAPQQAATSRSRQGWSPLQGTLFALGGLVMAVALAVLAWAYWVRTHVARDLENPFPELEAEADEFIDNMTVEEVWSAWHDFKNAGLGLQRPPLFLVAQRFHARLTIVIIVSAIFAAVGLLSIVAALFLRPRPRARASAARAR